MMKVRIVLNLMTKNDAFKNSYIAAKAALKRGTYKS